MKAQEGEGNSWTGIAVPACGDVLQGCHATPIVFHVLLCRDIYTPQGCPQDGLQPRALFRGPQGGMGFGGRPFLLKSGDPPQDAIELAASPIPSSPQCISSTGFSTRLQDPLFSI